MIYNIIFLQRKKLAISLGCALGTGVAFLTLVQCIMMFHPDPQSTPVIVQWLVGGMGAIVLLVDGMTDSYQFLPMAIRMGQTRKKMLPTIFIKHLLLALAIYLVGFAFAQLEWFLTENLWIHMVDGLIIEEISTGIVWWATAAMLGGGLLVGYFMGAVFARFGYKIGGYVLLGLWLTFIALQNGMLFGAIAPLDYIPPVGWGIALVALILWVIHSFLTMSVGSE